MVNPVSNISNYAKDQKITKNKTSTEQAAQDFAQIMMKQFLEVALKQDESNEYFGAGYGGEMFHDMMLDEYAKKLSEPGQIGLSEQILKELTKIQEGGSNGDNIK